MKISAGIRPIICLAAFLVGGCESPAQDAADLDRAADSSAGERQSTAGQFSTVPKTEMLPLDYDYLAPDGSEVRLLVRGAGGSMAQFKLPAGHTSSAVAHKTVEELWYVVSGHGQMWRKAGTQEQIVDLAPGISLSLPSGTHFQFRNTGSDPLEIIGVTIPPWPGPDEAYAVDGRWLASSVGGPESGSP